VRRRGTASRKTLKAGRRKTTKVKPTSVSITAGRSHSSVVDLQEKLMRQVRELDGAREQQIATAEILRVIRASPNDVQPVFETIVRNAVSLCGGLFANVFRFDGEQLHYVASHNVGPSYADLIRTKYPMRPDSSQVSGRVVRTKSVVWLEDALTDPNYDQRFPVAMGWRRQLGVPVLRDGDPIGVIVVAWAKPGPASKVQEELLKTFADQAVIAIENTRLVNELRESLQQQTATADVLKVISRSTFDLQTVLDTLVESATRLCEAQDSFIFLPNGDVFRAAARYGFTPKYHEWMESHPLKVDRGTVVGRTAIDGRVVHIPDVLADPNHTRPDSQKAGGFRAALGVPLLREGKAVGVIFLSRSKPQPFSEKQIELVTTFADQAVIAIENVRLFEAEQQRTHELTESLEQQTATSKVLEVISSSSGDLKPVFEAILENAVRLCGAKFGNLYLRDGDGVRAVAMHNAPMAYAEQRTGVVQPSQYSTIWQAIQAKRPAQNADMTKSQAYVEGDPWLVSTVSLGGYRSVLSVPMLHEDESIGGITIFRQDAGTFAAKQIELLTNFAKQAVIAIENARLLNELRESLQRQTATSEVLSVISSSPASIQPVLEIIGERAERLCEAEISIVSILDVDLIRLASAHGVAEGGVEALRRNFPMRLTDETITARAIRTRSVCHVADVLSDPLYQAKHAARLGGFRGCLAVPMVRDEQVVGAIFVARKQSGLFSDAQVQLLKIFADQAVIAIENVRLFNETKNSLEQQTATADVLKIISRSAFDLQTVLQTLVESAARFCAADKAQIIREKNGGFYTAEAYGYSREFMDYIKNIPIKAERGTASGRALVEGRVVHIADVRADPEYTLVEASRLGDFHTALSVPMLREGIPVGVLTLTRSEVQPFTDKQIELVTTFADQAAIAIENVRLFDEIQDKSRQLEEASQHKSQFLANMSHELRTPLNAILGYTELMADGAYGEPSEKMLGVLKRLEANGKHLLGLINDVLDLSKIEAGQLVLELSEYSIQDIAQTVCSTLEPLAADKKLGFKVEIAAELPPGRGDGRRLTQVLINLVGNAIKFTDAGEVAIKTEANNGSFYVAVRDTGPGISAADQAKLFQEFQQADNAITRKKGGTGLGLAISKRIIEMHGGRIWVESQPGQGSTFAFTLPVIVEQQANIESK